MTNLLPDRDCTSCKLHRDAAEVCVMGKGNGRADIMVIGRMPNSEKYQDEIESQLSEVGIDPDEVYYTSALKCRNFDTDPSNLDVKQCRQHLERELEVIKPKFVLTLGNEGLLSATGRSGITKYRGKVFDQGGYSVIPTISPAAVSRRPGMRPGYMADLTFFSKLTQGLKTEIKVPKYATIDTKAKLKKLKKALEKTTLVSFDIETTVNPLGEFDPKAKIISLCGTSIISVYNQRTGEDEDKIFAWALPLYHPESPWQRTWKSVLKFLKPALEGIPKTVAHNGKFDCRWLRFFGVEMQLTFDTMLAISVLNENIAKGLKPNAQARLGVAPWGVDTHNLLEMPLVEVLEYNFLDTYYTYLLYLQLKRDLIKEPRSLRIFMKLLMPASRRLVPVEQRGVWLDLDRLNQREPQCEAELNRIEMAIASHLPAEGKDYKDWPSIGKGNRAKPAEINYNASNFARWFLFDYLKLPVLERGKDKPDGSPGNPSMSEDVLGHLREDHPVVNLLLERVKWQKYMTSFFAAYKVMHDEDHRLHTTFKLAGTTTGRLSSGKVDDEKVSGGKQKLRGLNLQQVPRNPFIRGMIGAPPGWTFVEADFSQVELRVAAFLARERHMIHLYQIGADIHMETTTKVTGLSPKQITKEIRKKVGKPVNFGFLYGMGWRKFIETAFNNYGSVFTEEEARQYRTSYFELFPDLPRWHERQRRIVASTGRVMSPLGRIRHLPDIYSPDKMVRAEAERQAINAPVQGFASDMALLAFINLVDEFKRRGIVGGPVGLVHDAINFEIRDDHLYEALPLIKSTMEDLEPARRKFGTVMDMPLIADLKVGRHWGDAHEVANAEEVLYDRDLLKAWLEENHPTFAGRDLTAANY
ncbi:DNA polymerase [Streptomyces sp. NPDC002248]